MAWAPSRKNYEVLGLLSCLWCLQSARSGLSVLGVSEEQKEHQHLRLRVGTWAFTQASSRAPVDFSKGKGLLWLISQLCFTFPSMSIYVHAKNGTLVSVTLLWNPRVPQISFLLLAVCWPSSSPQSQAHCISPWLYSLLFLPSFTATQDTFCPPSVPHETWNETYGGIPGWEKVGAAWNIIFTVK